MRKLLSEIQDWIINDVYILTEADLEILSKYPVNQASDWKNKEYKPIRDRIRKHYFDLQNETCCYCRLPINKGSDNVEIEHIIDKNKRLDFIFEPKNMVVSCHKCNFTKSTKRVMHVCPSINEYPNDSTTFKIIHGHHDPYFDNIEFIEESIYHGLSDEGEFTIKKCGLDRLGLAEQRELVTMYQDDELISDVIEIRNMEHNDENIDALIEKLKALKNKK